MSETAHNIPELLQASEIFAGLDEAQLERLAELAEEEAHPEGSVVVEEDTRGSACYFLLQGRVDVEIGSPLPGRAPQTLATLKKGESFGELSLVDGYLRSASVRAVAPIELLRFDSAAMETLMEEDPAIGYRVMRNVARVLATRIRSSNMKLRNALSDVLFY